MMPKNTQNGYLTARLIYSCETQISHLREGLRLPRPYKDPAKGNGESYMTISFTLRTPLLGAIKNFETSRLRVAQPGKTKKEYLHCPMNS